jgi:serine/threonine protein kinase
VATSIPGIELGEVIGRGASSVVYAGVQLRFGRTVAVKVLQVPGRDEVAAALFATECQMLGRLDSHPDIVTVYDAGTTSDGDPYLVMEHLPGGTLARRLREKGRMAPDEVLPLAVRLSGALETAHRNGIVHGDVKPQNVLWSAADLPALADFGIARLRSTTMSTGIAVFTPLHAAPELFDGRTPTALTDVYGLGSTLFELLDGRPAAGDDTDTPLTVVGRIARRECRSLDPEMVPAPLVDVVERAMAYEPEDRFPSVDELGEALRSVERELGLPPTRMVVLDLPETTPTTATDVADRPTFPPEGEPASAGLLLGPSGAGTGPPPPGSADVPITDGASRRRGPRSALLVAVAAVVILAVGTVVLLSRDSDRDLAMGATTTSTTTTEAPPNSQYPAVQPDVTFNVPDASNTTPALEQALTDLDTIAAPIGGARDVIVNTALLVDGTTPAKLRYKSYHEKAPPYCAGFLTNPLTLTGQWGRLWAPEAGSFVALTVYDFADAQQAREGFVALALGQQPPADECHGFREKWGVEDYGQLDISSTDVPLPGLEKSAHYTTFLRPAGPAYPAYLSAQAGVVQQDATLVVFVVMTTAERGQVDPAAIAQFLNNVLARLPG